MQVFVFNTDLELATPAIAAGVGAVGDVALLRVKGFNGIVHIEGKVGSGGALIGIDIAGSALQDGTPQLLASSAATPASDFAGATYRKPGNSASPETTAANGFFWIDIRSDGLSDLILRASGAAATTVTITARVAERARI